MGIIAWLNLEVTPLASNFSSTELINFVIVASSSLFFASLEVATKRSKSLAMPNTGTEENSFIWEGWRFCPSMIRVKTERVLSGGFFRS